MIQMLTEQEILFILNPFFDFFDRQFPDFRSFHFLSVLFTDIIPAYNKFGSNGKFLGCEQQSLLCHIKGNSVGLDENPAGRYRGDKSFGRTFSFTHTYFSRLLRDGLIGEYADPDLTFTFHVTCHSLAGCFYLSPGYPGFIKGLDTE
jgi:hypothetical protein